MGAIAARLVPPMPGAIREVHVPLEGAAEPVLLPEIAKGPAHDLSIFVCFPRGYNEATGEGKKLGHGSEDLGQDLAVGRHYRVIARRAPAGSGSAVATAKDQELEGSGFVSRVGAPVAGSNAGIPALVVSCIGVAKGGTRPATTTASTPRTGVMDSVTASVGAPLVTEDSTTGGGAPAPTAPVADSVSATGFLGQAGRRGSWAASPVAAVTA